MPLQADLLAAAGPFAFVSCPLGLAVARSSLAYVRVRVSFQLLSISHSRRAWVRACVSLMNRLHVLCGFTVSDVF